MKRHTGNAVLGAAALVAVLAVFVGAGAWNYARNYRAEQEVFRPFRGVSDRELSQLADAYRAETDRAESRYNAAQTGTGHVRDRQLLGERLDEFERVRRRSERTRELGAHASELQTSLRAVEEELQIRESERDRMALFLRRLLTI